MVEFFPTPNEIITQVPLSTQAQLLRDDSLQTIQAIVQGTSKKKLLLVGPCSIHSFKGALTYALHLSQLKRVIEPHFMLLMRVHIEKPRTQNAWRGFVYDPDLNNTCDVKKGILQSRKLMLEIMELGLPITTEILDPLLIPYFEDLLSFATIGARTISSTPHRVSFSDLTIPIGLKNRIDGDIDSALAAIEVATSRQTILKLHESGRLIKKQTLGNQAPFLILRGSDHGPNYSKESLFEISKKMKQRSLKAKIIIDCAHGNAKLLPQDDVFKQVMQDWMTDETPVAGLSLESYLKEGKYQGQKLSAAPDDLSITDRCLSFEKTKTLLLDAYSNVISSNHSLCLNSATTIPSNVASSAL